MNPKARTLWPTLIDFEQWVSRNCPTCRWSSPGSDQQRPDEYCNASAKCLVAHLHDTEISQEHAQLILGPTLVNSPNSNPFAPHLCKSRKDKRGRPAKQPDTDQADLPNQYVPLIRFMRNALEHVQSELTNYTEPLEGLPKQTFRHYFSDVSCEIVQAIQAANKTLE